MSNDAVTYQSKGQIAVITMNRPERTNRLDADIVAGLEAAWVQFMASDEDRVAVLTGAGSSFSTGADLKAIPHDLFRGIPGVGVPVDKPVVGAVEGWCVGGGMVLTTMCDMLVAADNAMFNAARATPEITFLNMNLFAILDADRTSLKHNAPLFLRMAMDRANGIWGNANN